MILLELVLCVLVFLLAQQVLFPWVMGRPTWSAFRRKRRRTLEAIKEIEDEAVNAALEHEAQTRKAALDAYRRRVNREAQDAMRERGETDAKD